VPIAFVGANSVLNSTSGSSTAVPMPAGVVAGHMLYALVASVGASPTPTAPSGWALVSSLSPGSTLTSWLYRKVAVAGEPTATWSWSSQGRNLGLSLAYSGVDAAVSTNAAPVQSTDGSLAVAAPAVAANAGDWLVTIGVGRENPGTATAKDWTVNAGTDAQRVDVATAGATTDVKVSAAWFDSNGGVAAGSTARTVSSTPDMSQRHIWSVLLNLPAGELTGGNPWSHMGLPLR
jgi:hypothetical protein